MSYKRLGDYIRKVDKKNTDLKVLNLQGLSMTKEFRKSTSNIVGTDLSKYKIVKQGQFCCDFMSVIRVHKLPVVLNDLGEDVIISPAYIVFEVIDKNKLLSEYLMMWFRRAEFDRYADFRCDSSIRGGFQWEELCEVELPVPPIEKQREIVSEYQAVADKIKVNEQICEKLEATAQALYKHWFVDGIDVKNLPEGWRMSNLKAICEKIGSGSTPTGGKESYSTSGVSLIRSTNVFDYNFSFSDLAFINEEQAYNLKNVEVKENDILFNITGVSVARCCMVPENVLPARVNQHVMIIRPFKDLNISFYLLLNLCSTESKNALLGISQSGSTREAITKSEIEEYEVLIPKRDVLERFENTMQKIFLKKDLKSLQNQKLTHLQSLLLSRLSRFERMEN
jgi:type I restriction enzyme S subunit